MDYKKLDFLKILKKEDPQPFWFSGSFLGEGRWGSQSLKIFLGTDAFLRVSFQWALEGIKGMGKNLLRRSL
jgi:hypothetical protein